MAKCSLGILSPLVPLSLKSFGFGVCGAGPRKGCDVNSGLSGLLGVRCGRTTSNTASKSLTGITDLEASGREGIRLLWGVLGRATLLPLLLIEFMQLVRQPHKISDQTQPRSKSSP